MGEAARVVSLEGLGDEELRRHPGVLEAAEILRAGGLVAFPTETVYGLGADALSREAVAAIYEAKSRPGDNPSIVHLADLGDLERVAVVPDERVLSFLDRVWPGPLTAILPSRTPPIAAVAWSGLETVAVRIPDHPVARALIRAAGRPVAAPSANRSGRPSPTSAAHVLAELGDRIPLILDGGRCRVGLESTVVDFTGDRPGERPRIVRPGRIGADELSAWFGPDRDGRHGRSAPERSRDADRRSPGTRYQHYRPSAPVVSIFAERASDLAVVPALVEELCRQTDLDPSDVAYVGPPVGDLGVGDLGVGEVRTRPTDALLGHHLYTDFWELERRGLRLILVAACRPSDAVRDRLTRASSHTLNASGEAASPADLARDLAASLGFDAA